MTESTEGLDKYIERETERKSEIDEQQVKLKVAYGEFPKCASHIKQAVKVSNREISRVTTCANNQRSNAAYRKRVTEAEAYAKTPEGIAEDQTKEKAEANKRAIKHCTDVAKGYASTRAAKVTLQGFNLARELKNETYMCIALFIVEGVRHDERVYVLFEYNPRNGAYTHSIN